MVHEVPIAAIVPLCEAYRREMACQIVHDSWHARGFTRAFLIEAGGRSIGYAAVGGAPREPRDIVKELYLEPAERDRTVASFHALVDASGARRIEAQSNDPFLFPLLQACGREPFTESLLFAEGRQTDHEVPGALFRPVRRRSATGLPARS